VLVTVAVKLSMDMNVLPTLAVNQPPP
jgi:hypothetical protein